MYKNERVLMYRSMKRNTTWLSFREGENTAFVCLRIWLVQRKSIRGKRRYKSLQLNPLRTGSQQYGQLLNLIWRTSQATSYQFCQAPNQVEKDLRDQTRGVMMCYCSRRLISRQPSLCAQRDVFINCRHYRRREVQRKHFQREAQSFLLYSFRLPAPLNYFVVDFLLQKYELYQYNT